VGKRHKLSCPKKVDRFLLDFYCSFAIFSGLILSIYTGDNNRKSKKKRAKARKEKVENKENWEKNAIGVQYG
jgi:hypothetical protein